MTHQNLFLARSKMNSVYVYKKHVTWAKFYYNQNPIARLQSFGSGCPMERKVLRLFSRISVYLFPSLLVNSGNIIILFQGNLIHKHFRVCTSIILVVLLM